MGVKKLDIFIKIAATNNYVPVQELEVEPHVLARTPHDWSIHQPLIQFNTIF